MEKLIFIKYGELTTKKGNRKAFINKLSNNIKNVLGSVDYELKADSTAFNWMVDEKLYEIIKKNIINIDKYDCIKSFVVYRLANDKIISYSSKLYQINNGVLF